jgi:hypothetical protein
MKGLFWPPCPAICTRPRQWQGPRVYARAAFLWYDLSDSGLQSSRRFPSWYSGCHRVRRRLPRR